MGEIGHEMQSREAQKRNEIKCQSHPWWLHAFAAAQLQ